MLAEGERLAARARESGRRVDMTCRLVGKQGEPPGNANGIAPLNATLKPDELWLLSKPSGTHLIGAHVSAVVGERSKLRSL